MIFRHFVAALSLGLAIASPLRAEPSADAPARIAAYDDGVVAIMKGRLGPEARRDRFETLVREYYDMPAIASLVVGPKWATASATDRDAAIAALTRHSAISLARNFDSYDGEKFTVDPMTTDRGASKIVKVRISSPGGGGNTLLFVMRRNAGGWKIIDVVAQGVSSLAVQRADVAAAVAAEGAGGLAKRLAKLDGAAR